MAITITSTAHAIIIGSTLILKSAIKFFDVDKANVHIYVNARYRGALESSDGLKVAFADVTEPRVFASSTELRDYLADLASQTKEDQAICDATEAAVHSNTVDLPHPGFFEVRGNAGTVKFDPVDQSCAQGQTLTMAAGELSKFRVKRIYATGTLATSIVIYF